jgi:hypothetical protein
MHSLTPQPVHAFDQLIGRSANNRALMKSRGQLAPLIVPTPQQRADGLWREQIFVAADAVIAVAIDLLVEAGAARAAISLAMTDLQLEIIKRLSDVDDGKQVHIAFAHTARGWAVLSTEHVRDAIAAVADHFCEDGGDVKVCFFAARLHQAAAIVRQRAAEHGIDLPQCFGLTPEELDAGNDLLAAAIAPRTSPIIEQWQTMRQRETSPVTVS